jgi:hypothetical protein
MKAWIAVLSLFFFTKLSAQTRIEGEDYVKAVKMAVEAVDSGVVGIDGSYVDYPVKVTTSGPYTFTLRVMGSGYINIKTLTGTKVLAKADVVSSAWNDVEVSVKLGKTTKFLRLWFHGNVNLNYFTYETQSSFNAGAVSRKDFDNLKASVDSLIKVVQGNVYYLDGDKFGWKGSDSTKRIVTIK